MIEGKIVKLRGLKKEDKALIYEWVNRKDLRDKMGTVWPVSECEHDQWFENMCLSKEPKIFAIEFDGRCIGTIGLKEFDRINGNVEMYVRIGDDSARGKGCGRDAVVALSDYCFEHLNFHKTYMHVHASNESAIRCYEAAGFTCEGRLKEHNFVNGHYEDVLVMGRIRK
ncbi:MAG: GNAT family N-acetyltransferase [Acetatifactor sp.]|nr:GNAT family N-acetyltransferase [Acetatifactor sp.]